MATTINPVVHYRDLDAGARFLVETFNFVPHEVHKADDGFLQYVYGSRDLVAKDREGNEWCFGTYPPGS
jgi:hypothetical protein